MIQKKITSRKDFGLMHGMLRNIYLMLQLVML
nr:MAG TPA: hypothetical protein [Caudoviricetes sp.]